MTRQVTMITKRSFKNQETLTFHFRINMSSLRSAERYSLSTQITLFVALSLVTCMDDLY